MAAPSLGSSGGFSPAAPFEVTQNRKTNMQIKARSTQLQKELRALAKAEGIAARAQYAKELQFRTKYENYLTRGNFETSLLKKDGFKKVAQEDGQSAAGGPEHVPLHKLIYTKGEVDVEKVVCLHLLTVQQLNTPSLTDNRNLKLFPKRSKPNILEASALPFYIVEIIHKIETDIKIQLRECQDVIILVNSHIEKLVVSILEVLAIVSPQKLQQIKEKCSNKRSIQEIVIKTKNFNFLAQARDCPVLFKMENYRLEFAQFKEEPLSNPRVLTVCCIRVKDRSKKLEQIQSEIKKAIAKYSEDDDVHSCESWAMFHRRLCSCKRTSKSSLTSGDAIALLTDDGREFAMVTKSGCHIPKTSSIYCPSLTAIIKSSPRHQSYMIGGSNALSVHSKDPHNLGNEQNKIISSLLHKVNNTQRLLIGKRVAELKSRCLFKERMGKQKLHFNKIMENVFTKESLISFASTARNEELQLLFQPSCKGGLDIGSFILQPEKVKPIQGIGYSSLSPSWKYQHNVIPEIMKQEESIMNTAIIKQEIFTSETRTKMKRFLLSDNPSVKHFTRS